MCRAALVPYLAHKALGDSYKWLLYGDDDTVSHMAFPMLKACTLQAPALPHCVQHGRLA